MIRRIIKNFLISSVAIYLVSLVTEGVIFEEGIKTLAIAGALLSVATLIVKPVINILLLPLNLITFGFFRWVGYAAALYIVTLVVPEFKITGFIFSGFSSYWLSIPGFSLTGIIAFVAFSFAISLTTSILDWLLK